MKTCDAHSAAQWRKWLSEHHDAESEVWLIFHKRHTAQPSIAYEDAVNEALCFGWVDSLIKRLDEDRYARKFTPRTAESKWSTANRRRYAALQAAGRLAPPGIDRPPTDRSGDAPRPTEVPAYIQKALRAHPAAHQNFEKLPPSHRRQYVAWIDSAKQEATKLRRLDQALVMLESNQKLGMK
ncbi:MAG TPA: YdeI/OmpD-associated family protein [Candidatus Solibacter sp.]|jgi:uncharacterized protein YdeI (YjbR/CyaY-like superfamily)